MIPIHFEAYSSTAVPLDEPRKRLGVAVERRDLEDRVFALRTGERWMLPDGEGVSPWVTHEKASEPSRAAMIRASIALPAVISRTIRSSGTHSTVGAGR